MSTWRGLQIAFTDGICQKCAVQVRADHLRAPHEARRSSGPGRPPWAPGLAVVSLTVAVSLILVARPTHEPPEPFPVVAAPPTVVEPPQPSAAPATIVATVRDESPRSVARPPLRTRTERPVNPPARTVALTGESRWIPYVFAVVRNASSMPLPPRRASARELAQSP